MKRVEFTDEAERELDDILQYISANYPSVYPAFEARVRAILMRIGTWPESAQRVIERPDVRSAPLIRFPYRIFYRILPDHIEVLHVHHSARDDEERPS